MVLEHSCVNWVVNQQNSLGELTAQGIEVTLSANPEHHVEQTDLTIRSLSFQQSQPYPYSQDLLASGNTSSLLQVDSLAVQFREYSHLSPLRPHPVFQRLVVQARHLSLTYQAQLISRFQAYLMDDIITPLTQDFSQASQIFLNPLFLRQVLANPKIMEYQVSIQHPVLHLPISTTSPGVTIKPKGLLLQNYVEQVVFQGESQWQNNILIQISDTFLTNARTDQKISNSFDVNILHQSTCHSEYYQTLNTPHDPLSHVTIQLEPELNLMLSKEDFDDLMRVVFNNLAFDDYQDQFYYTCFFHPASPGQMQL